MLYVMRNVNAIPILVRGAVAQWSNTVMWVGAHHEFLLFQLLAALVVYRHVALVAGAAFEPTSTVGSRDKSPGST